MMLRSSGFADQQLGRLDLQRRRSLAMIPRRGRRAADHLLPWPVCKEFGARGRALTHNGRIDAVAGAVARFQRAMMMDVDQAAKTMKDAEIEAQIEDFPRLQSAHLLRHAGQWGPDGNLVEPARLERAVEAAVQRNEQKAK
jgi:hypothetical protein